MQPPGPPPLPPVVAAELAQLEWRLGQVAGEPARRELAELGEAAAVRVLRRIARSQVEPRTLTAYVVSVAVQEMFALNAQAVPTAVSLACNSAPSLSGEAPPTVPDPPAMAGPHSSSSLLVFLCFFLGWGRKTVLFFVHSSSKVFLSFHNKKKSLGSVVSLTSLLLFFSERLLQFQILVL